MIKTLLIASVVLSSAQGEAALPGATRVAANLLKERSVVATDESYATIPSKDELFIGEKIEKERAEMARERELWLAEEAEKAEQARIEAEIEAQRRAEIEAEAQRQASRMQVISNLNAFFSEHGAPSYAEAFYNASEAHNVPLEMLVGISMYETGWMKSDMFANQNNPGGLRCNDRADWCADNGFAGYSSVESGLQDKAYLLRNHYFNEGMTTLTSIQPVYAPSYENDGDGWIRNIASIMEQVKMFI